MSGRPWVAGVAGGAVTRTVPSVGRSGHRARDEPIQPVQGPLEQVAGAERIGGHRERREERAGNHDQQGDPAGDGSSPASIRAVQGFEAPHDRDTPRHDAPDCVACDARTASRPACHRIGFPARTRSERTSRGSHAPVQPARRPAPAVPRCPARRSPAGCPPGVPEGVVDKDVYRLGEIVDFFDSYHDFARSRHGHNHVRAAVGRRDPRVHRLQRPRRHLVSARSRSTRPQTSGAGTSRSSSIRPMGSTRARTRSPPGRSRASHRPTRRPRSSVRPDRRPTSACRWRWGSSGWRSCS